LYSKPDGELLATFDFERESHETGETIKLQILASEIDCKDEEWFWTDF
jgi:hypothetical protein